MERYQRFPSSFETRRGIPILGGLAGHIRRLSPGDKFIASVLTILVVISSLVGLRALQKAYLVEVPAHGGVLTEGIVGSPRFVNPLLALTDADRDLAALTYAGLMGIGPDGTLVPVLAESYIVSPDGKTYTFTIRQDATFSDGTPVTADDVVFTVEKAQDPNLKSPEYANWANVRAEANDVRQVTFTLPQPYAPFLEDTTLGILPARLWRNVADDLFPFSPLMQKPVGAGPFTVETITRAKDGSIKEYRLKAFNRYAIGRPYLDGIRLKFYGNGEDLAEALSGGRIESAYGIAREGALRSPYARVFGVFFNQEAQPVLGDAGVRKALSLAIDRTRIVNEILGGYGTPLAGPIPPGSGITPPPLQDASTRQEAARAALSEAEWTYEEGAGWTKDGAVMPTIVIKTATVPELKATANLIEADWEAIGVPVELQLYESGDLTQEVIRPRAYEALLFGEVIGRDRDLYAFWSSSGVQDPGLNIALYSDQSVDALLARAREERDPATALADIQQASDKIAAAYPAAFTHAPDFLYAVPKDLGGIVLPQITSPSDRFATVATWYRYKEYVWPWFAK